MKVVRKYTNAFDANFFKGILENEGIHAEVLNENIMYVTVVNTYTTSIELAVDDKDYVVADKILKEAEGDGLPQ